ncbi:MAG: DUF2480 family protein [Vicingus serpentipes]|nr:DUF2480 family protein [Vicingus serpentipes]
MDEIVNRVENSNLIQVSLDDYYPEGERVLYDIKENLHEGLVLVEKEFRAFILQNDWSKYQGKYVGIICSSDAIVPLWAFMLLASKIEPFAKKVIMGNKEQLEKEIFDSIISTLDFTRFQDKNVIVKGCGKYPIPEAAFVDFTVKLQGYAKNILFGEACSSVPLFKRKN